MWFRSARYELRIGWRYLHAGRRDRMMAWCAGASAIVIVLGIAQMLLSHANSAIGVVALVLGLLSCAVFGLLAVFSVFTSVSVLGVAFGVAALTIVLAVTTGFQQQFRDKVLGVNAHVIVQKSQSTFAEYRDVMATAMKIDRDVVAVEPFIFAEMLATRGRGELSGVAIKGVDPELVHDVLDLDRHMIQGTIDTLAVVPGPGELPPIIMGKEFAYKLKAHLGDDVTVVVPLSNIDLGSWPQRSMPRTRKFRITGIFYSGFDDYDRRFMYTALRYTQDLVIDDRAPCPVGSAAEGRCGSIAGHGDEVMGVEMKVKNLDRAEAIAEKLEKALGGPPYQVQDWYELNHKLFAMLNLQKLALVIILTLIIIVAAVNMVSALTMMVTDKTREIAILKSMGSTSSSVANVFLVLGGAIGGAGTVLGVGIGLATCYVVSAYGYHLDPKVYLIDRLPIDVRPIEVLLVALITIVISLVATVVPSRSAAALTPVEGLRYD